MIRGAKETTFIGIRYEDGEAKVLVVSGCFGNTLSPRYDLANHSPTGFEWGYAGSGPAQLALAILAYCLRDDERTMKLYQRFKQQKIAHLPRNETWELTISQVKEWADAQ